jgi:HPt (histidine-containing phosphotransfer) domain-containing protein
MSTIHLDETVLEELRDILEGEFPVLLQTYIADSIARLNDIEQAMAAADATALRKAAHSLKGSSGNLGLLAMAHYCSEIEEAGRSGNIEHATTCVDALRRERQIVEQLLLARA